MTSSCGRAAFGGRQAHEWGVATECVADASSKPRPTRSWRNYEAFQCTAKKLLNDTEDATLSLAIELEGKACSRLRSSDDFRMGSRLGAEITSGTESSKPRSSAVIASRIARTEGRVPPGRALFAWHLIFL
jgi:hypothetical protein